MWEGCVVGLHKHREASSLDLLGWRAEATLPLRCSGLVQVNPVHDLGDRFVEALERGKAASSDRTGVGQCAVAVLPRSACLGAEEQAHCEAGKVSEDGCGRAGERAGDGLGGGAHDAILQRASPAGVVRTNAKRYEVWVEAIELDVDVPERIVPELWADRGRALRFRPNLFGHHPVGNGRATARLRGKVAASLELRSEDERIGERAAMACLAAGRPDTQVVGRRGPKRCGVAQAELNGWGLEQRVEHFVFRGHLVEVRPRLEIARAQPLENVLAGSAFEIQALLQGIGLESGVHFGERCPGRVEHHAVTEALAGGCRVAERDIAPRVHSHGMCFLQACGSSNTSGRASRCQKVCR
mmetsp:Transcript_16794/g.53448  ORF Transcript_16794/g.53448 Transcript_16794/m.53448 type:complete len:355 (+) Transcript_16794:395-1459(+)